jgi:cell division protein FtsZ
VIDGAKGLLFSVAGSRDMTMTEVHEIAQAVTESIDPAAKVIFGTSHDPKVGKRTVRVTVIATNFNGARVNQKTTLSSNSLPLPAVKATLAASDLREASPRETEELLDQALKPYAGFEEPAFLRKKKAR